ncbi:sugar ABC transporter permease [Conexibacter sp. JD483]|uniref:carbohydrate ABC transporter permease n=1 Tax=unclassified Conexibacter TaxID=2627773 RepID=UPI00271948A7|nr:MULTISPECIES: sugar ABC transporter permease [unclassified Conexibacter]MDO8185199.1 sugar ABC transporter permease [Conexibacter sp. CPCC 205706]MDO8198245.1 sugar ABC transporter permease [Conexibacter sp. CPCC 205762]MDR9367793.1 sugar ABC transporter permease [Conexibacter sp. JD483]
MSDAVATRRRILPTRASRRRSRLAPYLFVAPYAVFLIAFGVAPALYALWMSFRRNSDTGLGTTFDGLGRWRAVLDDSRLPDAASHVGTYLLVWLPTMLVVIVVLALLAHARRGRFSTAMRFAWYLPGAVTGSAAALLWLFMISPALSPFGPLLDLLGIETATDALTPSRLPLVLALIATAVTAGGWIVVLYGAMSALPGEVFDAARVDGANAWQLATRIKLPMVRKYLALALVSCFAYGTQVFVEPQVLGSAFSGQISPTWSVNQLGYFYATQQGDFGMAAALSLMLLAVGLTVALVIVFRTKLYATDATER